MSHWQTGALKTKGAKAMNCAFPGRPTLGMLDVATAFIIQHQLSLSTAVIDHRGIS